MLTMFDIHRNTAIRESLDIEIRESLNLLLLLRTRRSQFRWFRHVSGMPQESLPSKFYMLERV